MDFGHKDEHWDGNMMLMQANLDDMNPEWCSHVADLLFDAGANDVYWIPIVMKKGRPGIMLNVLADKVRREELETVLFRETTTLGYRLIDASVHRLARAFSTVTTPWGEVQVKSGYHRGELVQFAPEFADCQRIAKQHGIPLKQVYDEVRSRYRGE